MRIIGKVVGKHRPRVTMVGGHAHAYTIAADKDYMGRVARAYHGDKIQGGAYVRIDVYRALPKSTPKRITWQQDTLKPDSDNIAKIIMDAVNDIAYNDDGQVVALYVEKHPRTRREEHVDVEILPTA